FMEAAEDLVDLRLGKPRPRSAFRPGALRAAAGGAHFRLNRALITRFLFHQLFFSLGRLMLAVGSSLRTPSSIARAISTRNIVSTLAPPFDDHDLTPYRRP